MLKRFEIFLGPRRFRAFVALLAITGLFSLALNAVPDKTGAVTALQTLLLLVFVAGAMYLVLSRLPGEERKRWLAVILPSTLVMVVGSLAVPALAGAFIGAGLGWIIAGIFIFRNIRGPQELQGGGQGHAQRQLHGCDRGDINADKGGTFGSRAPSV